MIQKTFAVILIGIFLLLIVARESIGQTDKEIVVSAAISLSNAFQEIGKNFKTKHKNVRILFNFGGSGSLGRQIIGGAPVDVFASASPKDMDDLDQMNMILKDTRINFAGNKIVLVVPVNAAFHLTSFHDLKRAEIKRMAIGNPKTVPAGRYAEEVLEHFKLREALKAKLIFAENARQVLDYVARGEVDAGMVYATDAPIKANRLKIAIEAPGQSHKPVLYPIAVIKGSRQENLGKDFISFVVSQEGKQIMKEYGFKPL
jgi:molybdate transport system substrate-binding protein